MKKQTIIIIVIIVASVFLINSNMFKTNQSILLQAFHSESQHYECNDYIESSSHTCQSICWQNTQAIADCMLTEGGANWGNQIGAWFEYHSSSSNEVPCKQSLETDMANPSGNTDKLTIGAVKCVTTLQQYGAVVPSNCNTAADTNCDGTVSWAEINSAISSWLSGTYNWTQINQFIGAWLG